MYFNNKNQIHFLCIHINNYYIINIPNKNKIHLNLDINYQYIKYKYYLNIYIIIIYFKLYKIINLIHHIM